MSYVKQGFADGQILKAKQLERIEDAVIELNGDVNMGYIGNFSDYTVPGLQARLKSWVSNVSNKANPAATFTCSSDFISLWNGGNTTTTLSDGPLWTVRLLSFGSESYFMLEFAVYGGKELYNVVYNSDSWERVLKLAFDEDKAPAGYGYGEPMPYYGTTDEAINGIFNDWLTRLKPDESIQICFSTGASGVTRGTSFHGTLIKTSNDYATLFAQGYLDTGAMLVKTKYAGVWGEWEWVNPPMFLGVEYRTTERWQGKPVYTKLINFGALPDTSTRLVSHGITGITQVIRCVGQDITTGDSLPMKYDSVSVDVYASLHEIIINTTSNKSTNTANVQMWYTKD